MIQGSSLWSLDRQIQVPGYILPVVKKGKNKTPSASRNDRPPTPPYFMKVHNTQDAEDEGRAALTPN